MSHSPTSDVALSAREDFESALDDLDDMIFEGFSFSGNEPNCGFLNMEGRGFATVSSTAGLDFTDDSRVAAIVDWDLDGDLDLWIQNRTGPQVRFLRNNSVRHDRFVAFNLRGNGGNTGGVGARLELYLEGERAPLARTLHAGDGFLTQSSRWVHFGLGAASGIERLVVKWPSGQQQEFDEIEAGTRYWVDEQKAGLEPWTAPRRTLTLESAEVAMAALSDQARVVMASPPPIPNSLQYESFEGELTPLRTSREPLLVNLWASWCSPCIGELRDFQKHYQELSAKGIQVLAVSVDGLGDDGSSPEQAKAFIDKLGVDFQVGMATRPLLEKLEILHHRLMDWRRPFPVPTTFLIGADGTLRAVYRGVISLDRVLEDQASPPPLAVESFEGRWHRKRPTLSLSHLAQAFLEKGYVEDAERYLFLVQRQMQINPEMTDPQYAPTRNLIALRHMRAGDLRSAARQLTEALRVDPESTDANSNLGIVFVSAGRPEDALPYFETALRNDPQNVESINNLGVALMEAERYEEAASYLVRALDLDPGLARVHYTLGLARVRSGRPALAIESLQRALEIEPEMISAKTEIARLMATSPVDSVRNGAEAIRLAEEAIAASDDPSADLLDILASAKAENGQFAQAALLAEAAADKARRDGQDGLAVDIIARKILYQQGLPYRHPK